MGEVRGEELRTHGGKRQGAGRKLVGSAPRASLSIRLDRDVYDALRQCAEVRGVSITRVVEDALQGFLGQTHTTPTEGF